MTTAGDRPAPVLQVDVDDPTPPYEQLRRQLEQAIRSGVVAAGARLPPIRQLARDLGLAVGTVARSYRELEAGGLVTGSRGGGTTVADGLVPPTPQQRRDELDRLSRTLLDQARLLGATDDDVAASLRRAAARRAAAEPQ